RAAHRPHESQVIVGRLGRIKTRERVRPGVENRISQNQTGVPVIKRTGATAVIAERAGHPEGRGGAVVRAAVDGKRIGGTLVRTSRSARYGGRALTRLGST